MRGSRGSSGNSNPRGSAGACAMLSVYARALVVTAADTVVRLAGCKPAHASVLSRPNTVHVFGLPASLACLVLTRPDGNVSTAVTTG
jgi:hypothetical protein